MDTFSTRDDVIVWMRDMNRYRDWYDRPIPIRYRYRYDPDTISKLCIINQRTVLNSNKRCPRVHSLIVWGIPLLVFFFLTSWDTPLPPPCLVGRLVGYPSLSFFMSSVSVGLQRFGQIVGLVPLFFVPGIGVHALDEPALHPANRFGIPPLKERARSFGALEVEAVLVLVRLGHGQDEGQVAIAAQVRGLVTAHVDGVQGVSDLVQIQVHVVGTAGHVALGVVVQGCAAIVPPHVPSLGVHLVVDQRFVATGTRLDAWIDLFIGKHLVEQVIRIKVRVWKFVGVNHGVDGPQNLLSIEVGLQRGTARIRTGLDSWHDDR